MNSIRQVRFNRKVAEDKWEHIHPSHLETAHLVQKSRYHMKNMLACLLELHRRRGHASVCTLLSNNISEYKKCYVKPTENGLRMFVSMEKKDA